MSVDYNATIHLPKTEFPMRAGLAKREPEMLESWKKLDVYRLIQKKNEGRPKFVLHDGPPFSNGRIHMGMTGFQAPYRPGWDNHGMPIESAIIKQNKLDRKRMSIPEVRSACQDFAQNFVEIQKEQFERLGVLG